MAEPARLLPKIRHAGAIFMGHHASEALGDYCAGPNHVLPTGRTARFSSPLGVYDFQKRSSVLDVSVAGGARAGPRWLPRWRKAKGSRRTREARSTAFERALIMRSPAEIVAAVVRPEIRALSAYAVARADGMIKLDAMEVPYRLPPEVAAKVAAAVRRRAGQPVSGRRGGGRQGGRCARRSASPSRSASFSATDRMSCSRSSRSRWRGLMSRFWHPSPRS